MRHVFKKILLAVDQGEPSDWATGVGYSMAVEMGAEVLLVHVVNHSTAGNGGISASRRKLIVSLRRRGRSLLGRVHAAGGRKALAIETALREGVPAEEILAAATDWGAHLIVIGAYGKCGLGNLMLGSTAETVARRARCPVVMVGDESGAALRPRVERALETIAAEIRK